MKNNYLKTLVGIAAVATAVAIAGCAALPTVSAMYDISRSVGFSAGLVVNQIPLSSECRNATVAIVENITMVVPETNQTFSAAWTPIAERHVARLVEEGRIDKVQGEVVLLAFSALVKGIDWTFDRYPNAKLHKDLVVAAIDGSASGFLDVVHPVNLALDVLKVTSPEVNANMEAYEYLRKAVLQGR